MNRFFVKPSQKIILSNAMSGDILKDIPLGYKKYEGARILPQCGEFLSGGVCTNDGEFIKSTSFVDNLYDGSYPFNEEKVIVRHCNAVFLGTWFPVYGHAITDNIKRLWFLHSEEYRQLKQSAASLGENLDLVYVYLKGGKDLAGYNRNIVKAAGIDPDSLIRINEVTQYDNVYIPDSSLIPNEDGIWFYTKEFRFVVDTICRNCNAEGTFPEKVYLTRTEINDGKDFGEKALECLFEQRGYTVVAPEKLTFEQQVTLMQHCKSLVATEGSVAHNSLFCKDGTEVVILRKTDTFNEYTNVINGVKRLNYMYVEAHHTITPSKITWGGHFFYGRPNT